MNLLRYDYGVAVRPFAGERTAGDAGLVVEEPGAVFLAIVDVLGHGPEAHQLAMEIVSFLSAHARGDLCTMVCDLHERLRHTRGAALGVARVDLATGRLRYVGIGNTVIRRLGAPPNRLVSRDGIVGHLIPTPREERVDLVPSDVVLLYSDGIREHFEVDEYPTHRSDGARRIARNVVSRFGTFYDDVACVALGVHR